MHKRFNIRYKNGDLPWNIARPDFNLINTVNEYSIEKGKALDIGCGTGDNVIWLAKTGFDTTGIDISENAVEMANEKIRKSGINASVHIGDFLKESVPGKPFDFIFDRGCFHGFGEKEERNLFSKNVYSHLNNSGLWLSLIGNYDDGRLDTGPPKRKASEIVVAVEPFFEIIFLKAGRFDSDDEIPSKIWVCLMRKKD